VAGLQGGLASHPYTTAKHAIIGLSRSAASELAPLRIRVNAVAPGGVITPLTEGLFGSDPRVADEIGAAASPMKLALYPRDIAEAFAYLASDGGRQVTGQVIVVDAGATMASTIPFFHTAEPAFLGPSVRSVPGGET
jgi:NAD(P)-dependent dehydrogenase (short-subunit alcohol dehydrogenase family)